MCKQLSQLSSAQAPVLLACKEILKQYIQSFLVKAFLSLALQPLSKGGIQILILPVMPACTWGALAGAWRCCAVCEHLALCFPSSQGCMSICNQTDSEHSFGVALVGFGERAACHKLAATLGAHGPE